MQFFLTIATSNWADRWTWADRKKLDDVRNTSVAEMWLKDFEEELEVSGLIECMICMFNLIVMVI